MQTNFMLLQAYSDVIAEKVPYLNVKIQPRTIQTYYTRINTLNEFLKHIKQPDMLVTQVNDDFVKSLELWMLKEKKCKENYFLKNLQMLKQVLDYCVRKNMIESNPLLHYKINFVKGEFVTLTKKEVRKIRKYKFSSPKIQRTADMFLLQCYTGLAYADLMKFDRTKHLRGNFIYLDRQKTEGLSIIPVKKKCRKLLKKYNYIVPRISNQKYNEYIKEVAAIVGIDKNLTSHVARKTFAELYLNAGASMEVVSRMLGHSSIKITQRSYARVNKHRIRRETRQIRI